MTTRPTLRAVLYARVSTDDPRQAGSCANQLERCRQYCAALGYLVVEEVADEGVSGSTMQRPGWKRAEAMLVGREADMVLSTSLDRMSRSLRGFLDFVYDVLQPCGASFGTLQESIDTSTAQGRMLLHMLLAFAQFMREQTAEKISASRAIRAAQGLHATRCVFGTMPGAVRGIPVPDPERWPALLRAFELKAGGQGPSAIARLLQRETGLQLNSSCLEKILASRFYLPAERLPGEADDAPPVGHVGLGAVWYRAQHRCTVPAGLWHAAQSASNSRARGGGADPAGAPYLLDGLVVTSHYEVTHPPARRGQPAPFVCAWVSGRGGKKYHCYVRGDRRRVVGGLQIQGGDGAASAGSALDAAAALPSHVNAAALDQLVLTAILAAAEDGQLGAALAAAYSSAGEQLEPLRRREAAAVGALRKLRRDCAKLQEAVVQLALQGSVNALTVLEGRLAELAQEEQELERQLADLRATLASLGSRAAQGEEVDAHVRLIRRAWQEGHSEALRTLVRALVHRVDLRLDGIVVEFFDLQPVLQFKGLIAPTGIEPVPSP